MHKLLAVAFGLNLFLGNLCTVPATHAEVFPVQSIQMGGRMEASMEHKTPVPQDCGSEHCLSQTSEQNAVSSFTAPQFQSAMVSMAIPFSPHTVTYQGEVTAADSPLSLHDIHTIVLRQ